MASLGWGQGTGLLIATCALALAASSSARATSSVLPPEEAMGATLAGVAPAAPLEATPPNGAEGARDAAHVETPDANHAAAGDAEAAGAPARAQELRAAAAAAEAGGAPARARELLRRALGVAAADRAIAYDLARLAIEAGPARASPADLAPFLATSPQTDDERALLARVLAALDDEAGPAPTAPAAPAPSDDVELTELRRELAEYLEQRAETRAPSMVLTAALHGELDSNVTLDDTAPPADRAGGRVAVRGGVWARPLASVPDLALALDLELRLHIANRDELAPYDSFTGTGTIAYSLGLGPFELRSEAQVVYVSADAFVSPFLIEGGGRVELTWPLGLDPGLYAEGSWRDFREGNPDYDSAIVCPARPRRGEPDFAIKLAAFLECLGRRNDRDGPVLAGGGSLQWMGEEMGAALRVGYQGELAEGPYQREHGIEASVSWAATWWRIDVLAALTFEWRRYSSWRAGRSDYRTTPQLDVRLQITDGLAVSATYFMVHNGTDASGLPPLVYNQIVYTRHVGMLGLEGAY